MEGVAEWQLAENAWIQVSVDTESAGRGPVAPTGHLGADIHENSQLHTDAEEPEEQSW